MLRAIFLLLAALFMATGIANADTTPNGNWSGNTDESWTYSSTELTISTAGE